MKFVNVLALVFVCTSINASDLFIVKGDLMDLVKMKARINKVIFTENKKEINLIEEFNEVESCEDGEYEIKKVSEKSYQLQRIISCNNIVDETESVEMCPEFYKPVCGELRAEGFNKNRPAPKTFSNMCELYISRASFISDGACKLE